MNDNKMFFPGMAGDIAEIYYRRVFLFAFPHAFSRTANALATGWLSFELRIESSHMPMAFQRRDCFIHDAIPRSSSHCH